MDITFPYVPKALFYCGDNRIERIERIKHTTQRPNGKYSKDFWEFVGTIRWGDTGKTSEGHMYAERFCHDDTPESRAELNAVMAALSEYLLANGEWRDHGWFAHRSKKAA